LPTRPHLLGQTRDALVAWARGQGATAGGAQVFAHALLLESADRAPNARQDTPSPRLLSLAHEVFDRALPSSEAAVDPDGTVRLAVTLADGALVETVLIHQAKGDGGAEGSVDLGPAGRGSRKRARWTACVSSQVGCARGCTFCETGRAGLSRNLRAHEIVAQVVLARRAALEGGGEAPTNVVFMGMGEPLDNLDEVVRALDVLREPAGLALGERRITVSTVGIVPQLDALYARTKANVAVSLHSLEPAVRRALLPVAGKWGLPELRAAIARSPRPVLLQWTLIEGQNDREADAAQLLAFAQGLQVRVNLIPLNPGPAASLRAPSHAACRAFQRRLLDGGVRALLRLPHGQGVGGACGQLAGDRRRDRGSGMARTLV
jgi:23S rRNA (adenine2503-C2)-methyltransferase